MSQDKYIIENSSQKQHILQPTNVYLNPTQIEVLFEEFSLEENEQPQQEIILLKSCKQPSLESKQETAQQSQENYTGKRSYTQLCHGKQNVQHRKISTLNYITRKPKKRNCLQNTYQYCS